MCAGRAGIQFGPELGDFFLEAVGRSLGRPHLCLSSASAQLDGTEFRSPPPPATSKSAPHKPVIEVRWPPWSQPRAGLEDLLDAVPNRSSRPRRRCGWTMLDRRRTEKPGVNWYTLPQLQSTGAGVVMVTAGGGSRQVDLPGLIGQDSIVSLRNLTEPSALAKLAPPGCKLDAEKMKADAPSRAQRAGAVLDLAVRVDRPHRRDRGAAQGARRATNASPTGTGRRAGRGRARRRAGCCWCRR